MIMAPFKDGTAERVVSGDIDTALVSEDASFDLPVSKAGAERERNILMHGLEGLEDKGVTHRRGFNAVREGSVDEVNEKGRQEEGDVGVVRVIRGEEVGPAGEGIGASKEFAGDMDHFQVEVGKVDEPSCLAMVECLGLVEIGKILVVGEDLHRERGTMEIVAPRFQGTNDGKKFVVIDVIVPFDGGEGLR